MRSIICGFKGSSGSRAFSQLKCCSTKYETNFTTGDEDLYNAILFTLSTTNGKLIASSTPLNRDSLFWRMCNHKDYKVHQSRWNVLPRVVSALFGKASMTEPFLKLILVFWIWQLPSGKVAAKTRYPPKIQLSLTPTWTNKTNV